MKPTFSIITITYNAEAVLEPTLQSVARQTYRNYEYIIIDGASIDGTMSIVKRYCDEFPRLDTLSEKDEGIYYAMNKGLDRASGEYVIFLNAGDAFSDEDVLHRIADAAKRTHGDIIYGQTRIVNQERTVVCMRHLTAPARLHFRDYKHGMLVCHQAFVPRMRIVPRYNTKYRFSADYEWCLRCLKQSKKNVYVGGVIVDYLEGGTTDKNHRASLKERFDIMCKYYGLLTAVLMHLSFIPRSLMRKL